MLAVNTEFLMIEHPTWLSTRQAPVVPAKVVSARETPRSGVLYGVEFVATKPLNGQYVTVTRFLFDRQLQPRIQQITKKPRQRKPKAVPVTLKNVA